MGYWDTVTIGNGERSASAAIVFSHEGMSVSRNPSAYWASNVLMEMGMTIYRSSPEGKVLTNLLQEDLPDYNAIHAQLQRWFLAHVDPDALLKAIEGHTKREFARWRAEKAREIRKALEET